MEHLAGWDMSGKATTAWVIDGLGQVAPGTKVPSDPDAIIPAPRAAGSCCLEAGPPSKWL